MSRVWLSRMVILALLAVGVVLTAAEGRGKSSRKKGDGEAEKAVAAEKKELPRAVYIDQFRKSKDAESMEIVALHDEIDQYYAELTTVRNVAAGEDREARKAEREVKGLEAKIKRQVRKLEDAVEKYTRPRRKEHDETRRKYEELRDKGDKLAEQGQERKATETYQMADRLTGPLEGMKRHIEVAETFLEFENAVPIEGLGEGDAAGEGDAEGKDGGADKGDGKDKGGAADKGDGKGRGKSSR